MLQLDNPASEVIQLREDAAEALSHGRKVAAQLITAAVAVLEKQVSEGEPPTPSDGARPLECCSPSAASHTVNTSQSIALMARLMRASSTTGTLVSLSDGAGGSGGGGAAGGGAGADSMAGEADTLVNVQPPIPDVALSRSLTRPIPLPPPAVAEAVAAATEGEGGSRSENTAGCAASVAAPSTETHPPSLPRLRPVSAGASSEPSSEEESAVISPLGADAADVEGSQQDGGGLSEPDIPAEFRCPISLELMRDPVVLETGQSYDRTSIQRWFRHGRLTCPKTGVRLTRAAVVPNHSLKAAIHDWAEATGSQSLLLPSSSFTLSSASMDGVGELGVGLQGAAGDEGSEDEEGDRGRGRDGRRPARSGSTSIGPLMQILSSGTEAAQESAARVVSTLSDGDATRLAITQAGGVGLLVSLLRTAAADSAREAAALALANLAVAQENKTAIAREQGIDALVVVLHSGGLAAKEAAARALLELAVNHLNRVSIALCGGIYPLVNLLRTGSSQAKEVAACALW